MIEYYPEIRLLHIAAVILSGSLFTARGIASVLGATWACATPLWLLSYTIDTFLVTAALMLVSIVQQNPVSDGWLTMKAALLTGYIILGGFALKGGTTHPQRLAFFLAALSVYGFTISVALAHHPLGFLSGVLGT